MRFHPTVAHETAHDIEARHPEINKATRAFLMKRKEEGDTVKLSTLTNNPEHTDDVHLDKWAERGGDPYTGRDYSSGHTEILSTGIQRLVEDPAGFRVRDPEHFELVVKILRGW